MGQRHGWKPTTEQKAEQQLVKVVARVEGLISGTIKPRDVQKQNCVNILRSEYIKFGDAQMPLSDVVDVPWLTVPFWLAFTESATLVHAYVFDHQALLAQRPVPSGHHAWVQFGTVCVDLTQPVDDFRYFTEEHAPFAIGRAKKYRGKKRIEAMRTKHRSYGFWPTLAPPPWILYAVERRYGAHM